MGGIIGRFILTLCCTILLAATVHAKAATKVYLKDGGIIECQKVWQAKGKVMVLVNRDTLVDLPQKEVDLKKTFAKRPATRLKKRASKVVQTKPVETTQQVSKSTAVKPAAAEVSPAEPAKPAAKPSPAIKSQQAEKAKPAQSIAKAEGTAKPEVKGGVKAVQQPVSSAKNPAQMAAKSDQPRQTLPMSKPAEPAQQQNSLIGENLKAVLLLALLGLLIIFYVVYKKKQQK